MTRTNDELPCPFCGSENREGGSWIDKSVTPYTRMHYVECRDCHARGPSVELGPKNQGAPVIEAWNKAMRLDTLITMGFVTPPDGDPVGRIHPPLPMMVTDHICPRLYDTTQDCDYCFSQGRYKKDGKS